MSTCATSSTSNPANFTCFSLGSGILAAPRTLDVTRPGTQPNLMRRNARGGSTVTDPTVGSSSTPFTLLSNGTDTTIDDSAGNLSGSPSPPEPSNNNANLLSVSLTRGAYVQYQVNGRPSAPIGNGCNGPCNGAGPGRNAGISKYRDVDK